MLLETIGLMGSVPALAASDTLPILSFEEGAAPRAIGALKSSATKAQVDGLIGKPACNEPF